MFVSQYFRKWWPAWHQTLTGRPTAEVAIEAFKAGFEAGIFEAGGEKKKSGGVGVSRNFGRRNRCDGRLFLENVQGTLIRRDGKVHGYCELCKRPVELTKVRRYCNRHPNNEQDDARARARAAAPFEGDGTANLSAGAKGSDAVGSSDAKEVSTRSIFDRSAE